MPVAAHGRMAAAHNGRTAETLLTVPVGCTRVMDDLPQVSVRCRP